MHRRIFLFLSICLCAAWLSVDAQTTTEVSIAFGPER